MKPALIAMFALVLATGLTACGGTAPRLDDSDQRISLAARTFGGSFDYLYVPTEGAMKDAAFITTSRIGRSDLSRSLATRFAPAERSPVRILVTGPTPEKTLQVVLDALSFHRDGGLPGLELLFVGDSASAAAMAPVVEAKGGRFRHALY